MSEGILSQISIGKEETRGTAVTPNVSLAVLPSDGVVTEQESVGYGGIDTRPAENKGFVSGVREYNGSFEMNAYPQATGYVLHSALGGCTSGLYGSEVAVYKHEFSETVTKPSYTLEQKIGNITERFAGFTMSGFSLELAVGEPLKLTFTGKALARAEDTAITPVYEATQVFEWTDVTSIMLGDTDIKCALENLNIEYSNNLGNFHGLCSTEPSKLYLEGSTVEGSMSAYLDDDIKALKQVFLDKSDKSLVITLVADEVIGAGSNNTLVITIPRISLSTFTHSIDTSYVAVESDFVAAADQTDGLIKVELINQVEKYAD